MRVINVNRGDVSLALYGSMPQQTFSGGMMPMNNNDILSRYVSDLNTYYQSDAYLQQAAEIVEASSSELVDVSIYLINNVEVPIGAKMQRYIMASPFMANAYDTGLIHGFVNGYQPDTHLPYEYRHRYLEVVSGELNDDGSVTTFITPETQLNINEQEDVKMTWDFMKDLIMNRSIDPSDI